MASRSEVVAYARGLVGVPFHHGQASRYGCDCIGLVRLLATDLGFFDAMASNPAIKPFLGYGPDPLPAQMRAALDLFMVHVPRAAARTASVVWMKVDQGEPRHLAILTERGGVIHATKQIGKVVEHGLTQAWLERNPIVGAWDFPGVTE